MANKESSKSESGGMQGLAERVTDTVKRAANAVGRAARDAMGETEPNTDPVYQILHAEHEEVGQLFEQLLATQDPQRARQIWTRVSVALLTHARAEQEIVYEAMSDREALAEDADHGAEEHLEIETLLLEANELEPGTAPFRAKVVELDRNVRHHVDDEEDDMLPKTAQVLSMEERIALVARYRARKDEVEPKIVLELTGREETGGRLPTKKSTLASLPDEVDEEDAIRATEEAVASGGQQSARSARSAPKAKGGAKGGAGGGSTASKSTKGASSARGSQAKRAAGSQDLDDHTVKELQELARQRGIDGRSRMRKEDLVAALSKA